MAVRKATPGHQQPAVRPDAYPEFGGLMKGDRHIIDGLRGKTIIFAVDDSDHEVETLGLGAIIRSHTGAMGSSRVMRYSEFFAAKGLRADMLILRSSSVFPDRIDALRTAIWSFRKGNPDSAVILCVYDPETYRKFADLADSGAVNYFYRWAPDDDPQMLKMGARILERLRGSDSQNPKPEE